MILERLLHHIGSCRAAADDANMLFCRRIMFFCSSWKTANNPCLETQKKATEYTHVSTVTQHLNRVQTLNVHRTPSSAVRALTTLQAGSASASQFREPLVGQAFSFFFCQGGASRTNGRTKCFRMSSGLFSETKFVHDSLHVFLRKVFGADVCWIFASFSSLFPMTLSIWPMWSLLLNLYCSLLGLIFYTPDLWNLFIGMIRLYLHHLQFLFPRPYPAQERLRSHGGRGCSHQLQAQVLGGGHQISPDPVQERKITSVDDWKADATARRWSCGADLLPKTDTITAFKKQLWVWVRHKSVGIHRLPLRHHCRCRHDRRRTEDNPPMFPCTALSCL